LQTIPGIGNILSLVLLYEIHDIRRFPSVQDFASYSRLVKGSQESGGKRLGTSGKKSGNAHLKWAFSEAAVLFLQNLSRHFDIFRFTTRGLEQRRRLGSWPSATISSHKR
jgi:transposase